MHLGLDMCVPRGLDDSSSIAELLYSLQASYARRDHLQVGFIVCPHERVLQCMLQRVLEASAYGRGDRTTKRAKTQEHTIGFKQG